MADISNVARLWDHGSFEWAKKVNEEIFNQGDQEKAMGNEVREMWKVWGVRY